MRRSANLKIAVVAVTVLVMLALTVGVTLAYLKATTSSPTVNKFIGLETKVDVTEEFDGTVKKNVNAVNEGTSTVYVRIKLASYRVNDDGAVIGGTATVPEFVAGANWLDMGGDTYVYALPVAPGQSPAAALISDSGIKLKAYTDDDGGKQAVDVIAEAIQATPAEAVETAWGVVADGSGVLSIKSN